MDCVLVPTRPSPLLNKAPIANHQGAFISMPVNPPSDQAQHPGFSNSQDQNQHQIQHINTNNQSASYTGPLYSQIESANGPNGSSNNNGMYSQNKYLLEITLERTVPDTQEIRINALNRIRSYLSNNQITNAIEECLSKELETDVVITDLIDGINIEVTIEDDTAAKFLVPLSDSGMLSRKVQKVLITQDFIQSCSATQVLINVKLCKENSVEIQPEICLSFGSQVIEMNTNILMKSLHLVDVTKGPVIWLKNNQQIGLHHINRFSAENEVDCCVMKINNVTPFDEGEYTCVYYNSDGRKCVNTISLEPPLEDLEPSNITFNVVSETEAEITWEPPNTDRDIKHYKVELLRESDPDNVNISIETDTCCIYTGLAAGQSYRVCVTTVFTDDQESEPAPLNGLQFICAQQETV